LDVWPWWEYIHAEGEHGFDATSWLKTDLPLDKAAAAWHSIDVYWHAVDPTHPIPGEFAA
jgi:hypothetical protein